MNEALDNVEHMTETILASYTEALARGDFARVDDDAYDFESVNARLWADKERLGTGPTREEFERQKEAQLELEQSSSSSAAASRSKPAKAGR